MGRTIEIIDPEGERRDSRRRKLLAFGLLVSACLFGYPQARDYHPKWRALKAGREFALYLSMLKTRAILDKKSLEARFRAPNRIEVFEVSSCGPNARRTKLWDASLSGFETGVEFAPEPWVRVNAGSREPFLPRFCYDPVYGSSVLADGLAHGSVFLAHEQAIASNRGEHVVQLQIEGASGDMTLE